MRASLLFLTMAVMLSGVCVLDFSVRQGSSHGHNPPYQGGTEGGGRSGGQSAACALAGEFRTVAANMLWIRAEKYHHEFIAHGGEWSENKDILPLIRLIVDLDPRFVEAYLTGGWMLATGLDRPGEALRFLHEGTKNNPHSSELHEAMGILYIRRLGQPDEGLRSLQKALSLTRDTFERQKLERLVRTVEDMRRE